jgi:uroporphyrinogen decarboxylase
MTPRDVVLRAIRWQPVPYVPWAFGFTHEARQKLVEHYGTDDLGPVFRNHFLGLGSGIGFFDELGDDRFRDVFGVVWNRSVDKDIGVVENRVLPEPTLRGYEFPDPRDDRFFAGAAERIQQHPDLFRRFSIGFALYERAWTMRGMEALMIDFYDHPDFVDELLNTIADYNIAQIERALELDIDCVHFGDDWGQQHGLQMGPAAWRRFLKPVLARMYGVVRDAGKIVSIHSCGDVDEVFDDLVEIGLDLFNPFQPEVMDIDALMREYRGRLAFHGGMSTQQTLPYGTVDDVITETQHLIDLGRDGGYIFSPAHAVEGDVPVENLVAFIDTIQGQAGFRAG